MISKDFVRGMGSLSLFPKRRKLTPLSSFIPSDAEAFASDLQHVGSDMWFAIHTIENDNNLKNQNATRYSK
jgi:hypothetical protein